MADQEQKGNEYIAEAEKKLKSSQGFFNSLFGGSSKIEEAAELFVRAANAYKMAKKWPAAGNAFCRAATVQLQLNSRHEAATQYVDAGNAYRKADPQEAVNCMLKAVEIYTDMGRFTIAAKHHMTIAEIYETDLADIEKAISSYEQAADYYKGEESKSSFDDVELALNENVAILVSNDNLEATHPEWISEFTKILISANKCLLKVAQFSAQLERYDKAVEIYEEVAVSCMDNSLLKYSAKDHFFRAAICHMCIDTLNVQQAIQKYEDMFPQFADDRCCKLLKSLITACEDEDVDKFTDAIKEYDSISRLDQWMTTMFLRIKNRINQDDLK